MFYKLEVFRLSGYDRIVYLDCDTLVLDDISSLWDSRQYAANDFYAVRETAEMGVPARVQGNFNTGVMVINRPLICDAVHRRMLKIARKGISYDGGDQGVINHYLGGRYGATAGELDAGYNVMSLVKKRGDWTSFKDRMRILHFNNRLKPWAPDHRHDWLFDGELKRLWDDAYNFAPTPLETQGHSERASAPKC